MQNAITYCESQEDFTRWEKTEKDNFQSNYQIDPQSGTGFSEYYYDIQRFELLTSPQKQWK